MYHGNWKDHILGDVDGQHNVPGILVLHIA